MPSSSWKRPSLRYTIWAHKTNSKLTIAFHRFTVEFAQVETGAKAQFKRGLITLKNLPENERAVIWLPALFIEAVVLTLISLSRVGNGLECNGGGDRSRVPHAALDGRCNERSSICHHRLSSGNPHLVLEAAAYIITTLASIFYSCGFTKYFFTLTPPKPVSEASFAALKLPSETIFSEIVVSCVKLPALSVGVLLAAAFVETTYAPWMMKFLAASPP